MIKKNKNTKTNFNSNKMRLAGAPSVAPTALPDHTNGHEKGYPNVRVSQGKPLNLGTQPGFY